MAIAEPISYRRVRTDWMENGCWIGKGLPLCFVDGPFYGLAYAHVTVCSVCGLIGPKLELCRRVFFAVMSVAFRRRCCGRVQPVPGRDILDKLRWTVG